MSEFLQLGGFDRLFQFFKNYQETSVSALDINQKEILNFLLKSFSMYLVAACALRLKGAY
jgi:ubiquitin carboxyl-terminal hydrolase 34